MKHSLENLDLAELNTIFQALNSITIKGSDAPFLTQLLSKVNNSIQKAQEPPITPPTKTVSKK
jgi:hypothetical protein|tara:strand:- start:540 stop:728 length:189 start_codon:yes stop_codon:yes gene_type:complete